MAKAKDFPGKDYDFVAVFDCLHDMGDPKGAAAHIRQSLANDGTWMIVEPFANDELKDNLDRRSGLLLVFNPAVHALLSIPGSGTVPGRSGWGGPNSGSCRLIRFQSVSAGYGNTFQYRLRGSAINAVFFRRRKTFLRSRAADISPRQLPFLRCFCLTFIPRALGSRQLANRHNTH